MDTLFIRSINIQRQEEKKKNFFFPSVKEEVRVRVLFCAIFVSRLMYVLELQLSLLTRN